MTDAEQTNDQTPADDASPEDIAEAKSLGWKDPSEWKGKPPEKGFMSAKEYVERGRPMLPVIKSQLEKERERSAQLADELDRHKRQTAETVKGLERMSKAALDQQRKQIEQQFAVAKEAAVEVGDKAAYRQHVKDEREALADLAKQIEPSEDDRKAAVAEQRLPKAVEDIIDNWKAENEWFDRDEDMKVIAERHHMRLIKQKPGLSLKQNLEEVADYVRKQFPQKFKEEDGDEDDEQPRRRGSPVEGGQRMNGGSARTLYSRLPADAKAQADRFIKEDGLFLSRGETVEKNMAQARERYAKEYFGDDQP